MGSAKVWEHLPPFWTLWSRIRFLSCLSQPLGVLVFPGPPTFLRPRLTQPLLLTFFPPPPRVWLSGLPLRQTLGTAWDPDKSFRTVSPPLRAGRSLLCWLENRGSPPSWPSWFCLVQCRPESCPATHGPFHVGEGVSGGGEGVSGVAGRAAQLTSVLGGLRLGAQSEGRAGVLSLTPCAELALPGLHRTRPLFIALSRRTGMDVSVLVPGVLTRACSAGSP